jgi:nucleoside-diphosphate-sugar epimerase
VYNIGGGSRVTLNQVLDLLGRVAGRAPIIVKEAAQKGDMRHTYADTDRAKRDLEFAPAFTLEQGLTAECQWLQHELEQAR